jgi:glycogen(starch) synthase
MRLAILTARYPPDLGGGIDTYAVTVAEALVQRGQSVFVVTYEGRGRSRRNGVEVIRVGHERLRSRTLERLLTTRRIGRAALGVKPDVVVAPEYDAYGWWLALRSRSVALVTRLASPSAVLEPLDVGRLRKDTRLRRRLERDQARRSAAIVAPSRAIAERMIVDWNLVSRRVHIIPNPIDVANIRQAGKREPPLALPPRFIAFFGRTQRLKGADVFARALPSVLAASSDVHAVFVGKEMPQMAQIIRGSVEPVADRVQFLGDLPRDVALSVIARAELVVAPSRWETFGFTVAEAMALGRPVVATAVGALPELIQNGVTGWLVPPGEVEPLADCILTRLREPDEARHVGEAASASVQRFATDAVVDDLLMLLKRVASRRAGERVR